MTVRRLVVTLVVVAGVALALAVAPSATAVEPGTMPAAPVVGPGVRDAVAGAASRSDGGPLVTVSLRDPTPRHAPVAALRAGARAAQSAVLGDLPPRGVEVLSDLQAVPALVVRLTSLEALDVLASHPTVDRVDLGAGGGGDLANAVPVVGGDLSHSEGVTGEGVTVAVLDSGIDTDHPDLAGDLRRQECFGFGGSVHPSGFCPNGTARQSGTGAAEDDAGHGTHVSGIITSDGAVSSVGMAPDAGVVAVKILDDCGFSGCFYDFTLSVVAALDWVIVNRATWDIEVINASLGTNGPGGFFAGHCDSATSWTRAGAEAVATLRSLGVTVVSSAGNDSLSAMGAPACLSRVISVGAANNADVAAGFSNASATTDVFAPGVSIVSDAIGGGTTTESGTSMASPLTAGCAALLLDARLVTDPAQLEQRLETSSTAVTAFSRSYPRIECGIDLCPGGLTDVLAAHPFCSEIGWLAAEGITGGFPDDTFRPSLAVSRGSMAAFLHRMAGSPAVPTPGTPTFTDVPPSHVFFDEIEWLAGSGITGGFADGTFRPGQAVSRGSMAAFLHRAAGSPTVSPGSPSFPDVPGSHVFFDEVEWLADTGITGGFPDDTYRPSLAVSRGSMAAFLFRFDDAGFEV
jgi:subtilisin family serine protease